MNDLDPTDWAALLTPVVAFFLLIYVGRADLGLKGILISFTICSLLLLGALTTGIALPYFISALAVVDIFLVFITFGGDFTIT